MEEYNRDDRYGAKTVDIRTVLEAPLWAGTYRWIIMACMGGGIPKHLIYNKLLPINQRVSFCAVWLSECVHIFLKLTNTGHFTPVQHKLPQVRPPVPSENSAIPEDAIGRSQLISWLTVHPLSPANRTWRIFISDAGYSTVTLFARFLGWSTSVPLMTATW